MKKRTFKQLNQAKRDRLEALKSSGHKQKEIAAILRVDGSTISREITRRARKDGRYQATNAQHKAQVKRSNSKHQGMKIEKYPAIRDEIITGLKDKRSPDEIAGRMKLEKRNPRVGKDAIYKWLRSSYGQKYCKYLCTKRYKGKKQKEDKTKRHIIPNMVRIEELPPEAMSQAEYGHHEGDTFVSPKKLHTTASAAIIVDKKSKLISGRKIPSMKPEEMKKAMMDMQKDIFIKTIVFDRGQENRSHEKFGVPSYFCNPHSPWQKPLVEGSIGLLRRWFWKKGTNLELVSDEEFQRNLGIINNKYRKCLGYLSANEVEKKNGILKI
jgi:IS30 family transposase